MAQARGTSKKLIHTKLRIVSICEMEAQSTQVNSSHSSYTSILSNPKDLINCRHVGVCRIICICILNGVGYNY